MKLAFEFGTEISCWMWTGERQTTRMRIKYLEAALNQDIQYFDTEVRTSDVVFAVNTDAVMVQDAISEKVKQNRTERNSPSPVPVIDEALDKNVMFLVLFCV